MKNYISHNQMALIGCSRQPFYDVEHRARFLNNERERNSSNRQVDNGGNNSLVGEINVSDQKYFGQADIPV